MPTPIYPALDDIDSQRQQQHSSARRSMEQRTYYAKDDAERQQQQRQSVRRQLTKGMSIPLADLETEWKPIFNRLDQGGEGYVPLVDLRRLLIDNPHLSEDLPEEVVDEILIRADKDQNGKLDFDEFIQLVRGKELGDIHPSMFRNALRYAAMFVIPRNKRRNYHDEYTCCPPPLFMPLISIIEVAVFIYYTSTESESLDFISPVPFHSPLIYDPRRRYEAWRYLTYMFIHAGYAHIGFNILIQLVLGLPLEMVHHWWRIWIVYLAGVVAGSLGTSIADPGVYLAGASGGVYAILAAHAANLILNWAEMEYAPFRLLFLVLISGSDVGVAVYGRYFASDSPHHNKVGYAAHLAGAIAGLLIGVSILRNLEKQRWEKVVWWISLTSFILLMAAAVVWNATYTGYFPPADWTQL